MPGDRALKALVDVAHNSVEPTEARAAALRKLGRTGRTGLEPFLIDMLGDRDPVLVHATAGALGRVGTDASVQPLLAAAMRHPGPPITAALERLHLRLGIPPRGCLSLRKAKDQDGALSDPRGGELSLPS